MIVAGNKLSKKAVDIQNMGGHIDTAGKNMSNIQILPTKMRISMIYWD